ncbi:MAG: hypothetical protein J3K34DRAFT_436911 [Monoraphidium minutum]|nr:MAG: hypothetical protein J3K34DRAFT_436911 [Monoraphidium minutum]
MYSSLPAISGVFGAPLHSTTPAAQEPVVAAGARAGSYSGVGNSTGVASAAGAQTVSGARPAGGRAASHAVPACLTAARTAARCRAERPYTCVLLIGRLCGTCWWLPLLHGCRMQPHASWGRALAMAPGGRRGATTAGGWRVGDRAVARRTPAHDRQSPQLG